MKKKRNKSRAAWKREIAEIAARRAAENSTAEMKICAVRVRYCLCSECLHYAECLKLGRPASQLGVYIAWLESEVLPSLRKSLNVRLEAATPFLSSNAYAVIRIKKRGHTLSRIGLMDEERDAAVIAKRVINAYSIIKEMEGQNEDEEI